MTTVAAIFARGGSRGVPHKNIADVAGRPLIAWAIQSALSARTVDRVIVSTDSPNVAEVAEAWGAEVPFVRPAELAQDDSPEWLAWQHALRQLRDTDGALPDTFVSVPPTAPLRSSEDVDSCVRALNDGQWDGVVTITPARRDPRFNMVDMDESGRVRIARPPEVPITRRQDAPPLFDLCTVAYAAKPAYVLDADHLFDGRIGAIVIPAERSLDIDTAFDLYVADLVMRNR